ncbi:HtaA domain-containing protein [Streptomyces sp. NPDC048002]|uniref:HtaA domain-containing protein n=1 Tax=Streptomyces sp. NPDC048002 TaxID=3154344 RepID=UPI0033F46632
MPVRSHRRPLALAAAVATAAALGATALATTTASAAEVPLSGYELTWGIKQSYRTYVTGFAAGSFTATDGASQAADNGVFAFTDGTGTYESTAHTVDLGFKGSLKIESTAHRFELTLSDVRFDSATAEVTADVTKSGTTTQDVPLADVTVTRSMTDMATTLTQEAADVFGSASYAGAAGDPLTVVQKTQPSPTASASPSTSASPSESASPSASASPSESASPSTSASPSASASASASATSPSTSASPSTQAPTKGDIVDGTLGWGVKESFRTYVVDGVAKGSITTSGGASQAAGNGVFTFVDAQGEYDTEADSLSASFEGAVNFKGHEEDGEYGLDLTLTGLEATLDGGSGELTADVTSLGRTSKDVVLAELKADAAELTAKNDVITLDDVTATLTDEGAEAFGGFYTAGTELDPVDLSVALTEDADLPDGDGGSGTGGSGTGGSGDGSGTTGSTTGGTGSTTGGITGGLAATGSDVPAAALGTAAAVTVAAGAGVVLAMRRRRTAE